MAKKQSFGDKVGKGSQKEQKVHVKLVRVGDSKKSGGIRFAEEIVGVPTGENLINFLADYVKNGK